MNEIKEMRERINKNKKSHYVMLGYYSKKFGGQRIYEGKRSIAKRTGGRK